MNTVEIDERLRQIRAFSDGPNYDPETAHSLEDALRAEVLQAIADGAPDPGRLAARALESKDIDFSRHCA